MKLGQRIILSFFVVILLVIIVLQIVVRNQKILVKEYIINNAEHFKTDWQVQQGSAIRALSIALEFINQDERLKTVYLEKNRDGFFAETESLAKALRSRDKVDFFNFILPDGVCFARLYDKSFYGDIVQLPKSIQGKTRPDAVSGITLVNDRLALKVIKPYYDKENLIGYVEIGQYLDSFIHDLHGVADIKIVLLVKKDLIRLDDPHLRESLAKSPTDIVKLKDFVVFASTLQDKYISLLDGIKEKTIEEATLDSKVTRIILYSNNRQFASCVFKLNGLDGYNIGAVLGFIDITPYLEVLGKIKFFTLTMVLFLCAFVSIIGIAMMHSVLSPLGKLTQTIEEVGKGDLNIVFESKGKDEISLLGQAFNQMVRALRNTTTSIASLNQEILERKKIENALRGEKARAERYFDLSGVMFLALNIKGEVTLLNKKSCEILEAEEQEILGKNWFDNFLPKGTRAEEAFSQVIKGEIKNAEYFENYIKTARGKSRHIGWHNSILKDDDGIIIGTFSSGQDITERIQAEADLKASEENYRKLTKELEQGQEATLNILEDLQEAKGTLEVSRQNFLNIVEKSTDSILIVDNNGIVKFANSSAVSLFGKTAQEMNESPLGLEITKEGIKETNIIHSDGSNKIVEMRTVNTEWEAQTMTLVLLHDMTERKNAENSLRIAAHEWRVTFDSIGEGLSLLDLNSRVVRCNKSLSDFINKPYSEIIGQDCHDLIHGQENKTGDCPIHKTLKTKKRSTRIMQKGDKWLSLSVDPLFNEQNELIGMIHSVTDLTEQKMIEQKLREYTDYVENIIETAQALIIGFDKDLNIQSVNSFAEKMLGKNRNEIIDNKWLELLIPVEYRDEIMQVLSNCLEGDRVKGYEIPINTGENKELMISWDSAELRDAENKITGIVLMGYDVSQRKEIEKVQRLAQLGTLVSHMAHEVNNPLMVISGRAQLSLMEDIQNDEVKANLDIVMKECQRAKDIIQRLLRFSRPSKGELKQTDINASLEELVHLIEHQFGLNNVHIKKDYAPDLPSVMVDEKQIHEVFMNLLTNAQDAIGAEGTISIKTKKEGNFIKITFTDTGEGISKEVLDKIFDPFFTTKKKGTGLGLSICYSIIKAHNGDLRFESVPGQGTTAMILLPYMQENKDV